MSSNICAICWEPFSKKVKMIECPSNPSSCKQLCCDCFAKTISDNFTPTCFSCNLEINKDYLYNNLNESQIRKYNDKMAQIFLEKEKQLLPDTMNLIMLEKKKEILRAKFRSFKMKYTEITTKMYYTKLNIDESTSPSLKKEINKHLDILRTKKKELKSILVDIESELEVCKDNRNRIKVVTSSKCPTINCRGFLSLQNKCEICDIVFCSKCNKEKSDNDSHKCNEDDIATLKLLKKETRPCPRCNIPISKIDGCDQMFCVVPTCRTTFSWTTGKIDNGITHNPEFFRFMRERGIEIQNNTNQPHNRCVNIFDNRAGNQGFFIFRNLFYGTGIKDEIFNTIIRETGHFKFKYLHFPRSINDIETDDLRFKYLKDEINEKKWMKILKMRLKKNEKNVELGKLFNLIINSISDILLEYISDFEKDKKYFTDSYTGSNKLNIEEFKNKYLPCRNKVVKKFNEIVSFLEKETKDILKKFKSVEIISNIKKTYDCEHNLFFNNNAIVLSDHDLNK